jgi:hypothetical protein
LVSPTSGTRVNRACVSAMTNDRTALLIVKPMWPNSAASNSSTPFLRSGFFAAFISLSTNGWQRTAPCPKMMSERVRMFAPSTVIATGTAW